MFDRVASTKGGTPIKHHVDPAKEPIVRTFRVSSQILCEKNARAFCSISASLVVRHRLVASVLSEIFTFVIKLWLMVFMVQTSEEYVTTGKS